MPVVCSSQRWNTSSKTGTRMLLIQCMLSLFHGFIHRMYWRITASTTKPSNMSRPSRNLTPQTQQARFESMSSLTFDTAFLTRHLQNFEKRTCSYSIWDCADCQLMSGHCRRGKERHPKVSYYSRSQTSGVHDTICQSYQDWWRQTSSSPWRDSDDEEVPVMIIPEWLPFPYWYRSLLVLWSNTA